MVLPREFQCIFQCILHVPESSTHKHRPINLVITLESSLLHQDSSVAETMWCWCLILLTIELFPISQCYHKVAISIISFSTFHHDTSKKILAKEGKKDPVEAWSSTPVDIPTFKSIIKDISCIYTQKFWFPYC